MLNKVLLIGHVGKEPEIRATQAGKEIASFSLATTERWKGTDGERKEKTEWHKVVVFNENLVRVARDYLKKGSKIYLEGSLQTRRWTDKDGQEKFSTEVVLQNFNGNLTLLDKIEKGDSHEAATVRSRAVVNEAELDEDLPF